MRGTYATDKFFFSIFSSEKLTQAMSIPFAHRMTHTSRFTNDISNYLFSLCIHFEAFKHETANLKSICMWTSSCSLKACIRLCAVRNFRLSTKIRALRVRARAHIHRHNKKRRKHNYYLFVDAFALLPTCHVQPKCAWFALPLWSWAPQWCTWLHADDEIT